MLENIKKLFAILGLAVVVALLIYLAIDTLSPARRHKPNPYEYRVDSTPASDGLPVYKEIRQIPIAGKRLTALALDPRDVLYVAADSMLFILTKDGHQKARINLDNAIHGLTAPDAKLVYAGYKDHITVYDYAGRKKSEWPVLQAESYLTSLAISENFLFAADAGLRLVHRYDKQGKLLSSIGVKDSLKNVPGFIIPSPFFDLLVDMDDQLWVVNPGNHTVEQYTESGTRRAFWGESGVTDEGFCGCCNPTHLAMLQDGSFVTSEKGLARIKLYHPSGKLRAVIAGPEQFDEGTVGLDLAVDQDDHIYVLDPARKCVRVFASNSQPS